MVANFADALSQQIPPSRTLDDYDIREFSPDDDPGFSSFAHVVGLARNLDLVISRNTPVDQNIPAICAQLDICLSAWSTLLPESKRSIIGPNREIDVTLFRANMIINT